MELVDIKVMKNKKGDLLDGPFFVKRLSFNEVGELHERREKVSDGNALLVQMCLVDSSGERVFKNQQLGVIPDRIGGVDMMAVLMEANGLNDFAKIGSISEKYAKNSSSDQTSE